MKFKYGFTLVELLLVIAVAAVIFIVAAPFSIWFYHNQLLDEARSNIINTLSQARHNAVLQKNNSEFGVKINSTDHNYVLFQGFSYAAKVDEYDETYDLLNTITASEPTEIVFAKLTGLPSATGTITLTYESLTKGILITDTGTVSKVETSGGEEVADSTAPEITAFTIPATAPDLELDITTFTATDDTAVTGYLVNESASTPSIDDPDWSGSVPTTYTFASAGAKTLYAWVKDAEGNISVGDSEITYVITGLVSYWSMRTSGTTVYDEQELNNGTAVNGPLFGPEYGVSGDGGSFDGINDYVIKTSYPQFDVNSSFSFGCWVKQNAGTFDDYSNSAYVLRTRSGNVDGFGIYIYAPASSDYGKVSVMTYHNTNGSQKAVTSTTAIPLDTWYHVFGVVDMNASTYGTLKLYVNGVFVNSITQVNARVSTGTTTLAIGRIGDYNDGYFKGWVDEVRVYNKALTQPEITALYNQDAP